MEEPLQEIAQRQKQKPVFSFVLQGRNVPLDQPLQKVKRFAQLLHCACT
jgi:hypothetical protein